MCRDNAPELMHLLLLDHVWYLSHVFSVMLSSDREMTHRRMVDLMVSQSSQHLIEYIELDFVYLQRQVHLINQSWRHIIGDAAEGRSPRRHFCLPR
jgi:hypothetical protein